jgi:hypothetical protein
MNTENKPEKRGDWWVRLCIDLKHLRMKKECLRVAEHALLEQSWVKSGSKSALFRIKEQLSKFMQAQQTKTRQPRKKKQEESSDEEELKGPDNKKLIQELISEVTLTQNTDMLTQLNSQIGKDLSPDLTD